MVDLSGFRYTGSMKIVQLLLVFIIGAALNACHQECINPLPPEAALPRLEQLAPRLATLSLCPQAQAMQSARLGNQYLFFVLPFGQIYLDKEAGRDWISERARKSLALAGYRTLSPSSSPSSLSMASSRQVHAEIILCPEYLQVSAFDLLLLRRIVADIKIHVYIKRPGSPLAFEEVLHGRAVHFRKFGFGPDLQKVFEEAGEKVFTEMSQYLPRR